MCAVHGTHIMIFYRQRDAQVRAYKMPRGQSGWQANMIRTKFNAFHAGQRWQRSDAATQCVITSEREEKGASAMQESEGRQHLNKINEHSLREFFFFIYMYSIYIFIHTCMKYRAHLYNVNYHVVSSKVEGLWCVYSLH